MVSSGHKKHEHNLLRSVFDLIDGVVEIYLGSVIKPFVKIHETFYSGLNTVLRSALDNNKENIADWFTANFITYLRTVLVFPCLILLSKGHVILPSAIVILVDFGDFLDGVVARYWVDLKKEKEAAAAAASKTQEDKVSSPVSSDDDDFEVVTSGSPVTVLSWGVLQRNRSYGGFVDAVCDKVFVVPCWISLLHIIPTTYRLQTFQYFVLSCLILAEMSSACIRFRAYFTAGGVPAPKVEGMDFSSSAVKADHVGKAKQTFEMLGTALYVIPFLRYFGLLFLFLAVPLAYESVRRKVKKRVIYVTGGSGINNNSSFDHKVLRFWLQAKSMGSRLIVGVPGKKKTDMILNACATSCVDEVIAEAPEKADLMFLEKQDIDFVISHVGQTQFVTDEVLNAECCLTIGEDGIARLVKPKEEQKED